MKNIKTMLTGIFLVLVGVFFIAFGGATEAELPIYIGMAIFPVGVITFIVGFNKKTDPENP